jgi:hypothetical protein
MSAFEIYEIGLDTLFCLDIILSFLTGFWHLGVYERRMPRIWINYIKVCVAQRCNDCLMAAKC